MTSTMQPSPSVSGSPAGSATGVPAGLTLRAMTPLDLDDLVRIDEATTGRSRREFYGKRLASLADDGRDVAVVADLDGAVAGFAFARVVEGEFGSHAPVGVLDWLGVDPRHRHERVGQAVLTGLVDGLRSRGVGELRTQADWHEHDLVGFFAAADFALAPRVILARSIDIPLDEDVAQDPGNEPGLLAEEDGGYGPGHPNQLDVAPPPVTSRVEVRGLTESDLSARVGLDRLVTGARHDRYYRRLVEEAMHRTGVRVSLVAEVAATGTVVGVLMARVDYGEYGRAESTAVLDTIVVHPEYAGRHIARAMLAQLVGNLRSLRVDGLRTEVEWADLPLVGFFARSGFTPAQRLSFVRSL